MSTYSRELKVPSNAEPVAHFGEWTLYELDLGQSSPLWPRYKLMRMAEGRRWGVRNRFIFNWSIDEHRFARCYDVTLMNEREPALAVEVEMWLTLNRDVEWVKSAYFMDDRDVDAERARLVEAREQRHARG